MRTRLILSLLLASFLLSCQRDDYLPKATSTTSSGNPSLPSAGNVIPLTATDWRFYVEKEGNQSNVTNYQQTFYTRSTATTSPTGGTGLVGLSTKAASFTLGMSTSALIDTATYCYWAYSFFPPTSLRVGRSLTLKANVRLDQVQGKGVSLVLRGDRKGQAAVLIASTEGQIPMKGTADFAEYSVTLPYTTGVESLIIYLLMMPNTTGAITFTDVSLSVK
ncbi:hypothetical protein GCM10027341_23850 [Spirosoma knui]